MQDSIDKKPLRIGVLADSKMVGTHIYHSLGDKYLRAITEGMKAFPTLIPAWAERDLLHSYLRGVQGLLLTGSHSNIEPHHYGDSSLQNRFMIRREIQALSS